MIIVKLKLFYVSCRFRIVIALIKITKYFFGFIIRGSVLKLFLASRGYFTIGILADETGFFIGEKKFIKRTIDAGFSTVLDIGANIGDYSEFALNNGAKKIISIEPNPVCFAVLEKKFAHLSNVRLFNVAITDQEGLFDLRVPSIDGHGEGSLHDEVSREITKAGVNYSVKGVRLSELLIPLSSAGLIKIDVEGSEFEVLKQLAQVVGAKNKYIQFEFNNHHAIVGTSMTMIYSLFPEYQLTQMDLITGDLVERRTSDPFTQLFLSSVFVLVRK